MQLLPLQSTSSLYQATLLAWAVSLVWTPLSNFVPSFHLSAITMILNVVLLIIGFYMRSNWAKLSIQALCFHCFGLFEKIFLDFYSMTDSQELDVLCYILVVSVGLAILFNLKCLFWRTGYCSQIMNKYLHMDLGKAMSLSGMCVALSAALVYDKKTVVLSVLGNLF